MSVSALGRLSEIFSLLYLKGMILVFVCPFINSFNMVDIATNTM